MVHINDRSVRKKQRRPENNSVKHGYSTKRYNKNDIFYVITQTHNTYGSNSTNIWKKQRSYLSQQGIYWSSRSKRRGSGKKDRLIPWKKQRSCEETQIYDRERKKKKQ